MDYFEIEVQIIESNENLRELFEEPPTKKKKYLLKNSCVYTGQLEDGIIRGFGTMYFPDGNVYQGFFEDNIPHY